MVITRAVHLDMDLIDELRDVMEDEFSVLIDTFIEDGVSRIAQLPDLMGSADALRRGAHSLKGGASNVGAVELARLCAQLESLSSAGDLKPGIGLIDAIAAEFEVVRQALLKIR